MRCFKVERFSRAMIELIHDCLNIVEGAARKAQKTKPHCNRAPVERHVSEVTT